MKNNWLLILFASVLWISCQNNTANQNTNETNTSTAHNNSNTQENKVVSQILSPTDFEAKFKATEGGQLIDVRTPEEVAQGAIQNSTNIDFKAADFKEKMEKLDKDKPVFVYCQGGVRSAKAADMCKDMGFKEVYDLEGGYGNYEASKH